MKMYVFLLGDGRRSAYQPKSNERRVRAWWGVGGGDGGGVVGCALEKERVELEIM